MRYPKLRELKQAVTALIKGPYTTKFPFQPHIPYDRFRGKPYFHEEDCIGCAACVQVCPAKALEFVDAQVKGSWVRRLIAHLDLCIFCGQCQANCPTEKGIVLSQEFDHATFGNKDDLVHEIEKEMLVCECCKEAILPYDQYRWVAKRLGPLSLTNPSLILFYFRELTLSKLSPSEAHSYRMERLNILCPRCRREAAVKS